MNEPRREIVDLIKPLLKKAAYAPGHQIATGYMKKKIANKLGFRPMDIMHEFMVAICEVREEHGISIGRGDRVDAISSMMSCWEAKYYPQLVRRFGWRPVPKERWAEIEAECKRNEKNKRPSGCHYNGGPC